MFLDGWYAFSDAAELCDASLNAKAYGDSDHIVKYTAYEPGNELTALSAFSSSFGLLEEECLTCVIAWTSEKNGSSGVYTHGWLPLGKGEYSGEVRFRK
jgi:hypothetical protein